MSKHSSKKTISRNKAIGLIFAVAIGVSTGLSVLYDNKLLGNGFDRWITRISSYLLKNLSGRTFAFIFGLFLTFICYAIWYSRKCGALDAELNEVNELLEVVQKDKEKVEQENIKNAGENKMLIQKCQDIISIMNNSIGFIDLCMSQPGTVEIKQLRKIKELIQDDLERMQKNWRA